MENFYRNLLDFLNANPNWKDILQQPPFSLRIVQCPFKDMAGNLLYPELYMLSYNTLFSDLKNPIVRACRGCIVSTENNIFKLVCAPFYKFFNYGEQSADIIDWNTAKVLEKVDGVLLKLFKYKNDWLWVTNRGWELDMHVITALPCNDIELDTLDLCTYLDLKNYALNNILDTKELRIEFDNLDPNFTYMFELISPRCRIICLHKKTDLVFLVVRNIHTFEEISAADFSKNTILNRFRQPKIFDLHNIDDVIIQCDMYNGINDEGVVVYDKDFNRIKIKCKDYLKYKNIKKDLGFTEKVIYEKILDESIDDILAAFPEILPTVLNVKRNIIKIKEYIEVLIKECKYIYNEYKTEDDMSANNRIAEYILNNYKLFSGYIFYALKSNEYNISFNKIDNKKYLQYKKVI